MKTTIHQNSLIIWLILFEHILLGLTLIFNNVIIGAVWLILTIITTIFAIISILKKEGDKA